MKNNSIILIGMPGVGKSTVGKALAEKLGFEFIDGDKYILSKEGKYNSSQEIIDALGEQAFLDLEKQRMLEITLNNKVIAPGGSIIYHHDLMKHLKKHAIIVYLEDRFENIELRERKRGIKGIIGLRDKSFKQLFEERVPLYSHYANFQINIQDKATKIIVEEILKIITTH